jgi:purine-binding chemotaxis protein CheW
VREGADALRRAFDAGFAAPPAARAAAEVGLLRLRAGGAPVAVRTLEAAGLVPAARLCPVPGARRELLGLAGVRGEVVPVYALSRLLGWPDAGERPAWLLLAGDPRDLAARVALACGAFEGQVAVPPGALVPATASPPALPLVASLDGASVPVADVAALLRLVHAP